MAQLSVKGILTQNKIGEYQGQKYQKVQMIDFDNGALVEFSVDPQVPCKIEEKTQGTFLIDLEFRRYYTEGHLNLKLRAKTIILKP